MITTTDATATAHGYGCTYLTEYNGFTLRARVERACDVERSVAVAEMHILLVGWHTLGTVAPETWWYDTPPPSPGVDAAHALGPAAEQVLRRGAHIIDASPGALTPRQCRTLAALLAELIETQPNSTPDSITWAGNNERPPSTEHPDDSATDRDAPSSRPALPRHSTDHREESRPMAAPQMPETVVRRFTENGCEVTAIIADPADAQQTVYGTVTRDGELVGSYYCADRVRQSGWQVVTAHGRHLTLDGHPLTPVSEGAAVLVITTVLTTRDSAEAERLLREATRAPSAVIR